MSASDTQEDFEKIAQSTPSSQLAAGISKAFNSDQTPAFPQIISNLFSQSNGQQQAGILNQLLRSVGSGAVGSGILGGLSSILGGGSTVTPQQAQQVPPETVQQLAAHAQQNNPSIVDEASGFYAQHPTLVKALGAGALALIMSHISQNRNS